MNWKKIVLKKIEEVKVGKDESIEPLQKFTGFEELRFDRNQSKSQELHMNMGDFYKYLSKHECGHIFKDVYGLEGKVSEPVG